MYCPSCGIDVAAGLRYCNRCGADLQPPESLVSMSKPKGLVWAISLGIFMTAGVAIGGLALVFVFALELFRRGFPVDNLTALAIIGMIMLGGVVALLSRQMSRLISLNLQPAEARQPKKQTLFGQVPTQLGAPREAVSSVAEHTTHTLIEPVYQEHNRKR